MILKVIVLLVTQAMIAAAAIVHGVPPEIARAVIQQESNFRCNPHGGSWHGGSGQVLHGTAHDMGFYGDLRDCEYGLEASMTYLAKVLKLDPNLCIAISLYNRGQYAVHRCSRYGRHVLKLMRIEKNRLLLIEHNKIMIIKVEDFVELEFKYLLGLLSF